MALSWPQVRRILLVVMVVSFGLAILGAVGEILGWWNDLGEALMSTGTIVGALAGLFTLVGGASQETVEAVHGTVEQNNTLLQESNTKLEKLDELDKLETLDDVQYELDRQTGVLKQIRDRM